MTTAYLAWSHREEYIKVYNPPSVSGYQAQIWIPGDLPGMEADGRSIRFSDLDGDPLQYYIQEIYGLYFIVWIALPADEKYILFYYGNAAAASESTSSIFDFFDDFTGASVDATKWNTAGSPTVSGGICTVYNASVGCSLTSKQYFGNCKFETYAKMYSTNAVTLGLDRIFFIYDPEMGCYLQRYLDENVYQYQKTDSFLDSVNIYAIDRIQGKPNRYYINNVQVDAPTISYNDPLDTSNAILFQNGGASSNGKIEISWVRVRKTAEVEPCLLFDFYYSWEHQNNVIVVLDNDIAENYYQGKVELSFLEGMNTDGSDIRFTDQFGNPLPYWIESFEDNVFTIWILFSTDNNYLYYHYGNPDAVSESSGSDVFDFFDDFSAVDTNKWTYSGATHYSYSNSTIQLNGTGNPSYILSKSTFENNSIIECKAYHPTPNSGFAGMYGAANNFSVWRFDGDAATNEMQMTYNPSGSQYLVDTRHRIANQYTIYGIELSGTVNKFYINGYLRDTMSSYCPTYPLYIYLSSSYNEGTVVYDWVRIRYHLSTEPRLRPLYDLSKLDPESIDINKSVDSAYTQLTAKFPHSNIPKKGSRIIYKVTGSDVTDLVMFYGFVSSINPTFGYLENSSTLIAFDDMSSLAQKRMPQYCSNNITYTADTNSHLLNYISHDLVGTEIFEGNIENLVMPDIANITMEFDTTSYEHLKKMMFMYGNYMKSRFALRPGAVPLNTSKEYRERLDSMSAYYMDFPDGAMYINASFTLTYPDLNLMSSPSIKYENSDGYNKVTVHGVLSNTKTKVYSSVVSKEVYEGTEPVNEYVYEDNFIYEKGSTATKEAVKWLLYFKTKRAKVNLKFVDRFKFDLYQRFKFSGFPDEFDNLTDNKQMETVYTYDPSADPVELNPWTYTKIDVSGVPTPKWMRITGIKYHKAFLDEYVELEGITDWIQSYIDEAVSAPYDSYINLGNVKPATENAPFQIQNILARALDRQKTCEYAVVQSVVGHWNTVLTYSGRTLNVYSYVPLNSNDIVLIVPDRTGTYLATKVGTTEVVVP